MTNYTSTPKFSPKCEESNLLSHEEMIGFQAENHDLIDNDSLRTVEQYVLHLIHASAYMNAAKIVEGKRVLDLGCNTGYGTSILSSKAKWAAGVDVSERAIAEARRKHSNEGITFKVTDGITIPFEDKSFDVVTSFQVIEHLVEYDSFFNELKRVLAPGGVAILTTPNALLRLDPGMKPWYEFHVREFSPSELEVALDAFFGEVRILGVRADEPLYSIEFNRLDKARRKARADLAVGSISPFRKALAAVRARLKNGLPPSILNNLKAIQPPSKRRLFREVQQQYGPKDFYYGTEDLDVALDLMAVCSESGLDRIVDVVLKN